MSYCPYPFNTLAIKSSNSNPQKMLVAPCCNVKPINRKEVDITSNTIHNFSETFGDLIHDIKNNKKNTMCNYCHNLEDNNIYSPRLTAIEDGKILIDPILKNIDITLGEQCNLRCRMCNMKNSNKLRIDYNEIKKLNLPIPQYLNMGQDHANQDMFGVKSFFDISETIIKNIIDISPQLDSIKFTGGEPLINTNFWNICENIKNENIDLNVTTNGTIVNKKVIQTFNSFRKSTITISIDGTEKIYEYIRYPYKWNKLHNNLVKIINNTNDNVSIHICSVLTIYNCYNLIQLIDLIGTLDKNIKWKIIPDPGPENSVLDIKFLPKNILQNLKENYANVDLEGSESAINKIKKYIDYCINVNIENKKIKQQQFLQDTKTFDTVRNQKFENYLDPKITNFMLTV
tara:strand:- start:1282 stop:2484 length:1203 start_codon:yes stop_codon:yes gene_type:complete